MKSVGVIVIILLGALGLYAQGVTEADLLETPALAVKEEVAPEVTPVTKTASADELEAVKAQLSQREALVEKLSTHLESALGRLNRVQSPITSGSTSMAALSAARAKLEQQNNLLRVRQEDLQKQIAELTRQKQLLDLENRQLFQALNGRPREEKMISQQRNKDTRTEDQKKLVLGY